MEDNWKSKIRTILIGILIGISVGAVVGFIAGTFGLPVAVIVPAVVVPVAFIAVGSLKNLGKN